MSFLFGLFILFYFFIFYLFVVQFLTTDYALLCELLEPIMSVREKEEFATTLVHAMHKLGKAKGFLCDIVMSEIGRLGKSITHEENNALQVQSNHVLVTE
jgi:hypothetical protein